LLVLSGMVVAVLVVHRWADVPWVWAVAGGVVCGGPAALVVAALDRSPSRADSGPET